MVYLPSYVLALLLFHQLLFYGQKKGRSIAVVGAVNYVAASIFKIISLVFADATGSITYEGLAIGGGILNGILYVTHFFVLIETYRLAGVSITAALVGSGVIVPVLVAWLVWSEPMTLFRWLAVLLVPLSLGLMRPKLSKTVAISLKGNLLLILCFLMAGTVNTVHKAMNVYIQPSSQEVYQCTLFITTAVASLMVIAYRNLVCSKRTVLLGAMVGLSNTLVLVFLMRGLARIPAVIFYPTGAAALIVLNLAVAMVLWHERPAFRQIAGMATAIAIIVLTNLGGE